MSEPTQQPETSTPRVLNYKHVFREVPSPLAITESAVRQSRKPIARPTAVAKSQKEDTDNGSRLD